MTPRPPVRWTDYPGIFPAGLILAVLLTATCLVCCGKAHAEDVPAWTLRGIAQVETGTTWKDIGNVTGKWDRGAIGEVGPWQLSPAVLRDLKVYDKRERIHAEPVFAESLTRAWLLRLYRQTGSWDLAVCAYHVGLKGDRARGLEYYRRVAAVGGVQ